MVIEKTKQITTTTLHKVVPLVFERVKLIIFEREVEGITIFFIVRKILWFFLGDSIQGKSSWFFLHKPTRYCEFESNRLKQMI